MELFLSDWRCGLQSINQWMMSVTQVIGVSCSASSFSWEECSQDDEEMGGNFPFSPSRTIKCPPWKALLERIPTEASPNTILFKALSPPKYWRFRTTFLDLSLHTILAASWIVCTCCIFAGQTLHLAWPVLQPRQYGLYLGPELILFLHTNTWVLSYSLWRINMYVCMLNIVFLVYLLFSVNTHTQVYSVTEVFMFLTSNLELTRCGIFTVVVKMCVPPSYMKWSHPHGRQEPITHSQ